MGGEGGSEWGSVGSMGKGTDQVLLAVTGPSQPSHVARMPHMAHISRCDASPPLISEPSAAKSHPIVSRSLLLETVDRGCCSPLDPSSLRALGGASKGTDQSYSLKDYWFPPNRSDRCSCTIPEIGGPILEIPAVVQKAAAAAAAAALLLTLPSRPEGYSGALWHRGPSRLSRFRSRGCMR
jgi:hypothetical protein